MIKIFGLKTCDSCHKATKWLRDNDLAYEFLDIRSEGFGVDNIELWVSKVGWELLLNRRSKTWRNLPEHKTNVINSYEAVILFFENPTLIKRPIIQYRDEIYVGFKEENMAVFNQLN